jgi:hypothetical protein
MRDGQADNFGTRDTRHNEEIREAKQRDERKSGRIFGPRGRCGFQHPSKADPGKITGAAAVATFRELYPRELRYGGNRSILLNAEDEIPEPALRHCLALTYHLNKREAVQGS